MKFLILSIIIGIYSVVQIFGDNNYDTIASDLQAKVDATLYYLKNLESNVTLAMKELNLNDLDFRNENRMVSLQKALDQKSGKNGVETCRQIFEGGIAKIMPDLRNLAKHRLSNMLLSVTNLRAVLDPILNRLKTSLAAELTGCQKSQATCNITGSYATATSNAANAAIAIFNDFVEPNNNQQIDKTVSSEIDNEIVTPVNACLASVH